MTLLSPIFLWSFLALLPLAAVYFLKVRPRRQTTTAYFLWDQIFAEKKANSLLQKLRDLFSLLLMILAFSLLAFALTRPTANKDRRQDLLIIVDTSASMQTSDGGGTRFDGATQAAKNIVRALNGNQRAAIVSAGNAVEFFSGFTESPRELLESIDDLKPYPGKLRTRALTEFFSGSDSWDEDVRPLLITDGGFDRSEFEWADRVEILPIGGPADNLGLVLADLIRLPSGKLGFYFQIASSYDQVVTADLVLRREGANQAIAKLIPLEIQPGINDSEFFEISEGASGQWIAEIDIEDALALDNQVSLVVHEEKPTPVFVATDERYFFETSILAFEEASSPLKLVSNSEEAQVTIFQGSDQNQTSQSGLNIYFRPKGESPLWGELGEEATVLLPRVAIEDHPALKYIDVESISFIGARQLEAPPGANILVESESGLPLIYRIATSESTSMVINMDPVEGGFYFSAWFPTLLFNTSIHLAGKEKALKSTYAAGRSIELPGHLDEEASELTTPLGISKEIRDRSEGGSFDDLGFYHLRNSSGDWTLSASTLSRFDTAPVKEELQDTTEDLATGRGIPYWLIAIAILMLASESLFYHRRLVG